VQQRDHSLGTLSLTFLENSPITDLLLGSLVVWVFGIGFSPALGMTLRSEENQRELSMS